MNQFGEVSLKKKKKYLNLRNSERPLIYVSNQTVIEICYTVKFGVCLKDRFIDMTGSLLERINAQGKA